MTSARAADLGDRYEQMGRLADLFDDAGEEVRRRARLGAEVLRDPAFTESAELSRSSFDRAEEDVRTATTGKHGLLTRSLELDADALVLRATLLTYRWIDELQDAAARTLGAIAGRAIGYLAPEVTLGGSVLSAGLIEADALERDGVTAYLNRLAQDNPELMEHITSGGGGLLESLQLRSLLTAGAPAGDDAGAAARGGLRACGVPAMSGGFGAAVRDAAGGLLASAPEAGPGGAPADVAGDPPGSTPTSLTELMETLDRTARPVAVARVSAGRFIAYLPGPAGGSAGPRLRLVGGDTSDYTERARRTIERAVADEEAPRVMLVGAGPGGTAAAEIGARRSAAFVVDQVVTAGAPNAHAPRVPETVRVLSLEDRSDPVGLLGSLLNAGVDHRVTVVVDTAGAEGPMAVAGARAVDAADHPTVREELDRLRDLGYLAG